MKKQPKKSAAAAGKDLISELPDEILHSIISRIACSKAATRTIALSSRWRNLWCSYPFVQLNPKARHMFYSLRSEVFQKFHDATMKRFHQDKLLGMKALNLSININDDDLNSSDEDNCRSPAVEQLMELASERKAEFVDIEIGVMTMWCPSLCLPFRLLSNSSAKTLKLERIRFASGNKDYVLVLNSLRSLHLNNVEFDDERLFANLIASSPVLETLELKFVSGMRKLVVSNAAASLKKLEIYHCYEVEEIQIAAFGLLYLHIENLNEELSIGLIAPQLNVLKLDCLSEFSLGGVLNNLCLKDFILDDEQVFLKLIAGSPLLETLQLINIENLKKLQLSNVPNLKKLVVTRCKDIVEIGLIAPRLNVLQISCCYKSSLGVMSCGDLNHLRFLSLSDLRFDDEQVFPNLIARNPLLETLRLVEIDNMKKLQLSDVPNLKTLVIWDCNDLEEILIAAAYELHSLHLETSKSKRMLHKIELIAPQLHVLEIVNYDLRMVDLKAIVLQSPVLGILELGRNSRIRSKELLFESQIRRSEAGGIHTMGIEGIEKDRA
ncbi:Putative FBD-associated F-box protein At5g22720 [Linum perenne]